MKVCFKCGAEKPYAEFYKHKAMADGHLNKCKSCAKMDVRLNRLDKIEYYREFDRARGSRQTYEYVKRYRESDPVRAAAHASVARALRLGRLWKSQCCMAPGCFSTLHVVAHHTHYDAPLSVVWLCQACHVQLHKQFNEDVSLEAV